MGHYVYKYVYNDEIIYIGKCDAKLEDRLYRHGRLGDNIPEYAWDEINNSEVYYCILNNATMSDVVESELIRRYKPKYNKAKMSEWSGLSFIEPVWQRAFDDRDKKIKDLEMELMLTKKQVDELSKKIENHSRLEWEYYSLANKYDNCVTAGYENLANQKDLSAKTFEEILDMYQEGVFKEGAYISECYDKRGNLTCKKLIYVHSNGSLEFDFSQTNCEKDVQGRIYWKPTDKTILNWNILRCWRNRGDNNYYRVI